MNTNSKLTWKEILSPTMTLDEYMNQYEEKIAFNYKTYEPKKEILQEIAQLLISRNEKIKIVVLGAEWCPDCNKNIPRMIKIINNLKNVEIDLKILYGIMVNALHKPDEPLWHKTRSPPEAVNPKFDLKAIPTFYFFNKKGNYLGQIQENPQKTIEEDTLDIIKGNI